MVRDNFAGRPYRDGLPKRPCRVTARPGYRQSQTCIFLRRAYLQPHNRTIQDGDPPMYFLPPSDNGRSRTCRFQNRYTEPASITPRTSMGVGQKFTTRSLLGYMGGPIVVLR